MTRQLKAEEAPMPLRSMSTSSSAAACGILSVVSTLARSGGGPTFSVSALCEAVARVGFKSRLLTLGSEVEEEEHLPDPSLVDTTRVFRKVGENIYSTALELCRSQELSLLHVHGLWTQPIHDASVVARKLKMPLIVSPRGMLENWAWRHHAWKKRPVWWLWQRRHLRYAACLHVTSQQEAKSVRDRGLINSIAVIPNGVELPTLLSDRRSLNPRVALFISRIHPKKGLLNLVQAWKAARPTRWKMIVCGPAEGGHAEEVKRAVREAGLSESFEVLPAVYGVGKAALFARASLFVLPTFSENFGMAIAEALSFGVPVITTRGAPWEELTTHRAGWWIDISVEALAAALREATALSDEARAEMGLRGRRLMEQNYGWPKIGEQIKSVYKWVLGQAERPDCVSK